jgi:hypothetical protein
MNSERVSACESCYNPTLNGMMQRNSAACHEIDSSEKITAGISHDLKLEIDS